MAVRLEDYQASSVPRTTTGAEDIGRAISSAGADIGRGITNIQNRAERDRAERRKAAISEAEAAQNRVQAEEKAAREQQQARDRITAVDKLGGVQREYLRQVKELEKTWIGTKSSPEFEKQKKNIFDSLMAEQVGTLDDQIAKEMQKSGRTWINSQLLSDLEKAYKEEAKAAEEAASNYANDAINAGATFGEQGDVAKAQVAFGMTRQELKNYADKMAADSDIPMKEFDANYMYSFLTGAAKSNPEFAWQMSQPESLANFMGRDYKKDESYFNTLSKNLQKHLEKPLEYGRNKMQIEAKKAEDTAKTQEAIDFMNNPIIMGARLDTVMKRNEFGDVSTFKDFYDMHKGKYDKPRVTTEDINDIGMAEDTFEELVEKYKAGTLTTEEINDAGAAEDDFEILADKYLADTQDARFKEIFEKEKNQTLKTEDLSFEDLQAYNKWKESGGGKGLTDRINDLGLEEDAVSLAFDRVDKLIKAGASEEDALESVFSEFSSGRIKTDVSASDFKNVRRIDLLKNITPEEAEEYIRNGTSKADIIKAQAEKLYDNSSMVGDGSIRNKDLHALIKQVAGITIDENGDVDNNLIKAFMARNYIQEHNASPEQINTFNKVVNQALTDRNFKDGIAKLANRPSFDDLFAKTEGTSRTSGIAGLVRSRQDDMNDYVENVGRDAYVGAMAFLAAGKPDEALAYYDQKVRQAYDFVKSDIIDTAYVNAVLADGGKPIVPVNGQMTEIVGRDANGEYILRSTGRIVNGTF